MTVYSIYGLTLDLDDSGFPDIVRRGLAKGWYERDEVEIMRACLRPGDRVLELGAGLGVTSMVAAGIVGSGGVMAFEANPALIPVIQANAARNAIALTVENRVLYPRATLPNHGPTADLMVGDAFWSSSVVGAPAANTAGGVTTVSVPTGALEDAIATHRANVLVMDIEGLEVDILESADLDGIEALVFETHYEKAGRERTDRAILGLLEKGFRIDFERVSRGVLLMERRAT